MSKHKITGTHKLSHDSIFLGKKNKEVEESDLYIDIDNKQQNYKPSLSSGYSMERENPNETARLNEMRNIMYDILKDDLKVIKIHKDNTFAPRRKPSQADFNKNFKYLIENLDMTIYTHSEVFAEFSFYFSENLQNMFRLLNVELGGKVSSDLRRNSKNKGLLDLNEVDFI